MTSLQNFFRGQRILITGASSGLGHTFARQLASAGAHLILTARREAALEALAQELSQAHGIEVQVIPMDLAAPGAAHQLFAQVQARGLSVDMLINNAGFGSHGRLWELPVTRQDELLRLNVEALSSLTHLFLPGMVQRGKGGILNLASTAAFMPLASMSLYAASKAFVLSLTEGLHEELRGTGVRAMALCPGPTDTEFHAVASTENMSPAWMSMTSEAVVIQGLKAYIRGKSVKVTGGFNWLLTISPRLVPRIVLAWISAQVLGLSAARARKHR